MPESDARKLRESAAAAQAEGNLTRALSIYEVLCEMEPGDPIPPHRAGELLNRLGRQEEAILRLHRAAELYAKKGFNAKAAAVCKIILGIDPADVETRYELWALQAGQKPKFTSTPAPVSESAKGGGAGTDPWSPKPNNTPWAPGPGTDPWSPTVDRGREAPGASESGTPPALPYDPAAHAINIIVDNPDWSEDDTIPTDGKTMQEVVRLYEARLGDRQAVPRLAIDFRELAERQIGQREAFVVSQVDGKMTFEDILDVSGMPRIEALSILLRLLGEGIIVGE